VPARTHRIAWIPIEEIQPADRNPKGHDLEEIQDSIRRHGFVAPLILDEASGRLVAGHGRVAALEAMRDQGEPAPERIRTEDGQWMVPVVRGVTFASPQEAEAYLLSDNRLTELGGWDDQALLELLREVDDLAGTGFGEDDLASLERALEEPEPETSLDDAPELPDEPATRRGDLWVLDGHRILCGDATERENWRALMGGDHGDAVFTDPPYGISHHASDGTRILGDDRRGQELLELLAPAFKLAARFTTPEAAFYVWHHAHTREDFARALAIAGLVELQYLIWAKPGIALGSGDYRWAHEPCFYVAKVGERPAFYGNRDQPTVWRISEGASNKLGIVIGQGIVVRDQDGRELFITDQIPRRKLRHVRIPQDRTVALAVDDDADSVWEVGRDWGNYHPTQKPVELGVRALRNSTRRGQLVLDPFLGSGSTLISAEATGRRCYGLELEPRYVDVTVARWERITGRTAEHQPRAQQPA
jgi:DNA modification methylase